MFVHFQSTRYATLLTALAAWLVIAPVAASAEERPVIVHADQANIRTERVAFASLDLAAARDQSRLRHRVGAAVERVCLRDIGRDGLQDRGYDRCASSAWDGAAPQIADAIAKAQQLALRGLPSIAATAITVSAS